MIYRVRNLAEVKLDVINIRSLSQRSQNDKVMQKLRYEIASITETMLGSGYAARCFEKLRRQRTYA